MAPRTPIPLRARPDAPDASDAKRLQLVNGRWDSQNELLRQRDRQVELHARMLLGNQHVIWSPTRGRYEDIEEWMAPSERRWRKRPVVNRLSPWFAQTHARVTENSPIITFLAGPDELDMEAAETLDLIVKSVWFQAGMVDVNDRTWVWALAAGVAYQQSYIDLTKGDLTPLMAQVQAPLYGPDGEIMGEQDMMAPIDKTGQVAMGRTPEGGWKLIEGRMPEMVRQGSIGVRNHSPLEIRGEWNANIPWHKKRYHLHRGYLTPEEVYANWGIELEADTTPQEIGAGYELQRLLFGTGYFGAAGQAIGSQTSALPSTTADPQQGLCQITTMWEKPCDYPGMQQTQDSPGGRLTIVSRGKVIRDGVRPIAYPYTSPFREFGFLRLPGRPHDTTALEFLVPLQQAYNRLVGQIMEHTALRANPAAMLDKNSGLSNIRVTNEAGKNYHVNMRPGIVPISYLEAPSLSQDVYKALELIDREMDRIGGLEGTEPIPVTSDTSGEALKEQRFNTDRFLGPTMRRAAEEYGRQAEDWRAILPVMWPQETIMTYAGDDNMARTIVVYPDLFTKTNVNVRADTESMLPEGRGEKRQQVMTLYSMNVFGQAGTPEANEALLELGRFAHPSRVAKQPGGMDRITAEQFLGRILAGIDPRELRWQPWYDATIHLTTYEHFLKGPGFLRTPEEVQTNLTMWWLYVKQEAAQQQLRQAVAAQTGLPPEAAEAAAGASPGAPASPMMDTSVIPISAAHRPPRGMSSAAMPTGMPSQ